MEREKIYLRVIREDDRFIVVDQDGRQVARVVSINIDAGLDDPTNFTVTARDHDDNDMPHLNLKRKIK